MFEKTIIIDAKDHLMGHLAAVCAKHILAGQKIVVVRCEQLRISGSLFRNKLRFLEFLRKRMATNPKRGPFHHRAPSKIFLRTVRGMIPYKTPRGEKAFANITAYEGVPPQFQNKKKVYVNDAHISVRLKSNTKTTVLGELAAQVGWKYSEVVAKKEEARKKSSAVWFKAKKRKLEAEAAAKKKLESDPKYKEISQQLAKYGY